jgi:hypothetical protein
MGSRFIRACGAKTIYVLFGGKQGAEMMQLKTRANDNSTLEHGESERVREKREEKRSEKEYKR